MTSQHVKAPFLTHLEGLRALACAWVVNSHFANPHTVSGISGILGRGYIPTSFFIVLSGFTTHYASARKPLETNGQLLRFHLQRIGRIYPLHSLTVLVQVFITWWFLTPLNLIGSLLLTTSWNCYSPYSKVDAAIFGAHQCDFYPFNNLHWTLSTLLFSWLLYPLLRRPMLEVDKRGTSSRVLLVAALLPLALLPALLIGLYSRSIGELEISLDFWMLTYKWPPARVLDFAAGMAMAQLARDQRVLAWPHWPRLVDASAAVLFVVLLWQRHAVRGGLETYSISGLNAFFGIVLLGGCAPGACERSALLRLATLDSLSRCGKFSFHMYLLQELTAKVALLLQALSDGHCSDGEVKELLILCPIAVFSPDGTIHTAFWMPFYGLLIGLSAWWYHRIEEPWVCSLRARLDAAAAAESLSEAQGQADGQDAEAGRAKGKGKAVMM